MRAGDLPRVAGGAVKVVVVVSGQNRRARSTRLVRFDGKPAAGRVEE